tara:strand:- start:216 stop:404 length:189 start_codon:yes stop_codon:yes gene_type:complete
MIFKILLIILTYLLFSCGYPDIDNVPDFNNLPITDVEISDFCNNMHSDKKNIDKCIDDYKSN